MDKETLRTVRTRVLPIVVVLVIVVWIGSLYMNRLNQTVSDNIISNISELAQHDQNSIQKYVEMMWDELGYVEGQCKDYNCSSIEELEERLNMECANGVFSHLYLVADDGRIFTDKFVTYNPKKQGQNGRMDLLSYFEDGRERVVTRFDDEIMQAGVDRESVLYGIRLDNYEVDGVTMYALVGISDISNIREHLSFDLFSGSDGTSRGYSAVIDRSGNYVVNIDSSDVYENEDDTFKRRIEESREVDLSWEKITEKMGNQETFSFYGENSKGVGRIVYCMPFKEDGIDWYFITSVEESVFSEQNKTFLVLSMAMLWAVIIVLFLAIFYVISSQKRVFTAKAEAKAQSTFLANMSHEIRTPLNGIIGLIYLLEKDVKMDADKEIINGKLEKAGRTAEYLLSLINNILDISKLEAGKVELKRDVISVDSLAEEIHTMQRNNIESRGVEFVVEKDIKAPWVIGDELLIKQILMNILGNAAKFTPAGGRITFSVSQEIKDETHALTTFTCRDTGCGMSPEFLDHIWDSFSQDKNQGKSSTKGTGLGMAISKLLTDAMGGNIRVESKQGEDSGSCFYVSLNLEIGEEPENAAGPVEIGIADSPDEKIKILVAEDNELNAEILLEILKEENFEVELATDGQKAIDLFAASAEGEIAIILMDMQMPVKSGCEATREIRNLPRGDAKTVHIFACTANNFNEDRQLAEDSGMDDFLSKPIDVRELLKKIGR
jgi:signal transduction histidine kinase/CheY-like chemotaxis protein